MKILQISSHWPLKYYVDGRDSCSRVQKLNGEAWMEFEIRIVFSVLKTNLMLLYFIIDLSNFHQDFPICILSFLLYKLILKKSFSIKKKSTTYLQMKLRVCPLYIRIKNKSLVKLNPCPRIDPSCYTFNLKTSIDVIHKAEKRQYLTS